MPRSTALSRIKTGYSDYFPWVVVLSGALLLFYDFTLMNTFNSFSTEILHDYNLTATQLGALSACYYYANLSFLFLGGLFTDRISTRVALLVAMGVFVSCTFWFALTDSIVMMKLTRFIMGICSTVGFLGCMRLATRWFPEDKQAFVIGLIITLSMFGGVLAQTPVLALMTIVGWKNMILYSSIIGVILFCIMYANVRDAPYACDTDITKKPLKTLMINALCNYKNWLLGLYASFMNLPMFIFGAEWGSIYLIQAHSLTKIQASEVSSMLFVGAMIGSTSIGWLSDKFSSRKWLMLMCSIFTLFSVLLSCYTGTHSFGMLSVLFFSIGYFSSGQILIFPLIAANNKKCETSTATSIASTLIMSGGILQLLFGRLLDLRWNHWVVDQVPQYSIGDYQRAIAMIPITLVIAMICLCSDSGYFLTRSISKVG